MKPGGLKAWFGIGPLIAGIWRGLIAAAPVKIWAQIGAAMAFTVLIVGFGLVIWKGPWLVEHQALQLEWLGRGMVISGILSLVALVAITGLSVNLDAGRNGLRASIDQDEAAALPPVVRTVTETTVTPGVAAADADDGELPAGQRVRP